MRTEAIGVTSADAVWDKELGLWVRPHTLDDEVGREAATYVRWMPPRGGDTLLDVGANIGAVGYAYLATGLVDWVVGFEPEPDNCRMWRANMDAWGERAVLWEKAVVHGDAVDAGTVDLLVSEAGNRGAHSTLRRTRSSRRTVEVEATGLRAMLAAYRPTLLKVDIEGGEYDLERDLADVGDSVRAVAIEYHLNVMPRGRARLVAAGIDAGFRGQGFRVVREGGSLETGWYVLRFYARGD